MSAGCNLLKLIGFKELSIHSHQLLQSKQIKNLFFLSVYPTLSALQERERARKEEEEKYLIKLYLFWSAADQHKPQKSSAPKMSSLERDHQQFVESLR